ncbi:MAG: SCP2 sterol-binding domain-containing protein [Anaerolineae bacterium]
MAITSKEQSAEVFAKLLASLQANQATITRYTNWEVSTLFKLTDLGTSFSLRFAKGQISGSIDDPAPCTIAISLNAKVLDDIFSGRLDGESAYTMGMLSLQGSEYTAQSLLGYMSAIKTAYKQANP